MDYDYNLERKSIESSINRYVQNGHSYKDAAVFFSTHAFRLFHFIETHGHVSEYDEYIMEMRADWMRMK